jgi:hypothetical protein
MFSSFSCIVVIWGCGANNNILELSLNQTYKNLMQPLEQYRTIRQQIPSIVMVSGFRVGAVISLVQVHISFSHGNY